MISHLSKQFRRAILLALITTAAFAQTAPLPANYQTILNNPDLLVMRVHYAPHEFVPMHDHSAYPTLYVYLNDAGPIRIDHEPPVSFSVTRPPTHTGAFRLAPGMTERHSITNLSDTPSDFLRVEFKTLPPQALTKVFRGEAPKPPYHSTTEPETLYTNPALRVERIICAPAEKCDLLSESAPSVLVIVPLESKGAPAPNPVMWLPANENLSPLKSARFFKSVAEPFELLRIVLLRH